MAVARDERTAAGVGLNGQDLFVSALAQGATLGEPVLRSQGKTEQDRLTPPSWDAQGGLWVADRNPARPGLYLLEEGAGRPLQVRTPGLEGRIQAVRVAADGVRIALVVEKGDQRSLLIGRIERSGPDDAGSGEHPTVTVVELRSATPELEQVTAMSWAGDSRLVVVGREHGGVEQMKYVEVDGSTPDVPPPAALTGVKALTAAGDERAAGGVLGGRHRAAAVGGAVAEGGRGDGGGGAGLSGLRSRGGLSRRCSSGSGAGHTVVHRGGRVAGALAQ